MLLSLPRREKGVFLRVTWLLNTQLSPLEGLSASRDVAQTLVCPVPAWPELRGSCRCSFWGFAAFPASVCVPQSLLLPREGGEGLGWFLS